MQGTSWYLFVARRPQRGSAVAEKITPCAPFPPVGLNPKRTPPGQTTQLAQQFVPGHAPRTAIGLGRVKPGPLAEEWWA